MQGNDQKGNDMNLTELIQMKPTWLTQEIKFIKRGRNRFYIDERTAQEYSGVFRIVKPIASARGKLFFVCPCCQRIHSIWIKHIIERGEGIYTCLRHIGMNHLEQHIILDTSGIDLKEELLPSERWR